MPTIPIERYLDVWTARVRFLKEKKRLTPNTAARKLAQLIRRRAPKSNTGALHGSIHSKNGVVEAKGINTYNGFPYIHFVNQTRGMNMTTLHSKKGYFGFKGRDGTNRRFYVPRLVYGKEPGNWRWSGQAGFFSRSVADMRPLYRKMVRQDLEDALTMTF